MNSLIYKEGTASVTDGSATVTGQGTAWALALVTGGMFSLNGMAIPIAAVESDTTLTLAYAWPGPSLEEAPYAIGRAESQAVRAAWINDRLASFHQKPWGIGVQPDGRGTLAERDALNPIPETGYIWLRHGVDEPIELHIRADGQWVVYPFRGDPGDNADLATLLAAATPFVMTDAETLPLALAGGTRLFHQVTIANSRVLAFPSGVPNAGITVYLKVRQNGTGGHSLTYAAGYEGSRGVLPVINNLPNAETLLCIVILSPTRAAVFKAGEEFGA